MLRFARIVAVSMVFAVSATLVGCSGGSDSREHARAQASKDVISSARIAPDPAYASNRLDVAFPASPFANAADFDYVWKRNGSAIPDAHESSLAPQDFHKGDEISVLITAKDPNAAVKHFETPTVTIRNSAPTILEASTFMSVRAKPEIYVEATATDVDDDAITYRYQWYKNGQPLKGETGDTLDPSNAGRDDQVFAELVASDGEASSTPFRSDPIAFENHSPRITSAPPAPKAGDTAFYYQVEATDEDADALTYELVEAPEGMSISELGVVSWVFPASDARAGQHVVKIKVSDPNGGAAVQKFTLTFEQTKAEPQKAQQ